MKFRKLFDKFKRVWKEDGIFKAIGRVFHFAGNIEGRRIRRQDIRTARKKRGMVLFINGCCVEHPTRYRVFHQMEQLEEAGISCAKVYFEDIELEMEDNYQLFIFYRCECTEDVKAFIERAKSHHKKVCFDVDDLITDTKYTDQVPFVQELSPANKKIFDTSVMLTGKTLSLCELAITTTEMLAEELGKVNPETYINRNTASKEMVACAEQAYKERQKNTDKVWLGYFSGSLTHNKDFEIIRPALIRILDKYPQVGLILAGELDTSDELRKYEERIIKKRTTSWRELPKVIVQADINLAPLEDTIFNRSKSEIKWIEAALVRVPTVASRLGAFERMIVDGETGVLCGNTEEEWVNGLSNMIEKENEREVIAQNAYKYVTENCTTVGAAKKYAEFVQSLCGK